MRRYVKTTIMFVRSFSAYQHPLIHCVQGNVMSCKLRLPFKWYTQSFRNKLYLIIKVVRAPHEFTLAKCLVRVGALFYWFSCVQNICMCSYFANLVFVFDLYNHKNVLTQ